MGVRNHRRGPQGFSIRNLFFAAIAFQVVILCLYATTHWSAPRHEGSSSSGTSGTEVEGHGTRHHRRAAAGLLEKDMSGQKVDDEVVERKGSAKGSEEAITRLEAQVDVEEKQGNNHRQTEPSGGSQSRDRVSGESTVMLEPGQTIGDEASVCIWERPGEYDGDKRLADKKGGAKDFLLVGSCGGKSLHVAYVEESAAAWRPSTSAPPAGPPPLPAGTAGGGVLQAQGGERDSWRYIRGAVRYGTVAHCAKPVIPHRYSVADEPPAPCGTSASHEAASPSPGVYILRFDLPFSGESTAEEEGAGAWVTMQRGLRGCVGELEKGSGEGKKGCEAVEGGFMHSKVGSMIIKQSLGKALPSPPSRATVGGEGGQAATGATVKRCDTSMDRGYWGHGHEWVRTPPCVVAQPQREYPPDAPVCVLGNGKYAGPTSSTLVKRWLSPLTSEVFFPEEPECTASPEGCRIEAAEREDLASCFDRTTIPGGVIIIPLSSIGGSPTPAEAVDAVKGLSRLLAKMNSNPRSNDKTCMLVLAAHDTGGSSHLAHPTGDSSSPTEGGVGVGGKLREGGDVWTRAAANNAAREAAINDPLNIHFVDGFHASEPLRFNGKVSREEFPPSFYQMQAESIMATVHDKCGIGLGKAAQTPEEEDPDSDAVRERHRREEKRRDSYRIFVAP